jgi:hypothetical protein
MATFSLTRQYSCAVAGKSVTVTGQTNRYIPIHWTVEKHAQTYPDEFHSCAGMPDCGVQFQAQGCPFGR